MQVARDETPLQDTPGLRPKRACRSCVQIKAKCIPFLGSNGSICEQCHRLNKPCTTPAPASRKSRHNKTSQFARLEERLNNLTEFVTNASTTRQNVQNKVLTPATSSISASVESTEIPDLDVPGILPTVDSSSTLPSRTVVSPRLSENFTFEQQQALFTEFRTDMSYLLPFVVISDDKTADFYSLESPFLFTSCIAAALHRSPIVQKQVAEDMLKYVGYRMLVACEKSLDLLQGLLILISWYQFYSMFNPQVINLLHLSMALVIDLGFNATPGDNVLYLRLSSTLHRFVHGGAHESVRQTADEYRTLLGVYYVNSKFAACFRRLEHMRWTPYMEDCLLQLSASSETSTDALLVQLIKIQRLVERCLPFFGTNTHQTMPVQTYVSLFTTDFENLRQNMPTEVMGNTEIRLHMQAAQICLFEPILTADCVDKAGKVQALHTCLALILEFLDIYESQPDQTIPNKTFLSSVDMVIAMDMLTKLMFVSTDGWDLSYVRSTVNFPAQIDRITKKFDSVQRREQTLYPGRNLRRFATYSESINHGKHWYEARIASEQDQTVGESHDNGVLLSEDILAYDQYLGIPTGLFSDSLWHEMMKGDWMQDLETQ